MNYLTQARVWEVKIKFDNAESKQTSGLGYCGFISMERIINGMDRSIGPEPHNGSSKIHDIIKILMDNSSLPLRSNWPNIIPSLRSAKELLASTDLPTLKAFGSQVGNRVLPFLRRRNPCQ